MSSAITKLARNMACFVVPTRSARSMMGGVCVEAMTPSTAPNPLTLENICNLFIEAYSEANNAIKEHKEKVEEHKSRQWVVLHKASDADHTEGFLHGSRLSVWLSQIQDDTIVVKGPEENPHSVNVKASDAAGLYVGSSEHVKGYAKGFGEDAAILRVVPIDKEVEPVGDTEVTRNAFFPVGTKLRVLEILTINPAAKMEEPAPYTGPKPIEFAVDTVIRFCKEHIAQYVDKEA